MSSGWVKIHRSLLNWEWWDSEPTLRLWLTILLSVNHEQKEWHGMVIEPGEMVTSVSHLSKISGLTIKQVRNALNRLKRTNEITTKGASKFTLIKVEKWGDFQVRDESEGEQRASKRANKGQTKGKQRATNKNVKNDKNVKKKEYSRLAPPEPVPDFIRKQFGLEEEELDNL